MLTTQRSWTKQKLERDLCELRTLLRRAKRESRGSADDLVAQQLLQRLIRRRRTQLNACRERE